MGSLPSCSTLQLSLVVLSTGLPLILSNIARPCAPQSLTSPVRAGEIGDIRILFGLLISPLEPSLGDAEGDQSLKSRAVGIGGEGLGSMAMESTMAERCSRV